MSSSSAPSAAAGTSVAPVKISTVEGFAVGSCAAMTAVLFSNPAESIKTRMQLQGELAESSSRAAARSAAAAAAAAGGTTGASVANAAATAATAKGAATGAGAVQGGQYAGNRLYKGALDCFVKTARTEGIRGVQRGLGAALIYQLLLNGSRLGFYEPFRKLFNRARGKDVKEIWAPAAFAAGASTGVVGAILGNPLFLVKARQQAYSPHHQIGRASYNYKNFLDGLATIVRTEGVRGLTRGMDAAVLRTSMGSTVQLPAYNYAKTYLINLNESNTFAYNPLLLVAGRPDSFWTYLVSSTFSGACVCAAMQPADTALSRVYNQPTKMDARGRSVGVLYRGPLHCLYLTAKTEGPLAWYKGTTAHFARIAPHTVLTLVLNEAYLRYYSNWKAGRKIFGAPAEKVL